MKRLLEICVSISAERDTKALLWKIISAALDISGADAGTLFLLKGDALEAVAARCLTLEKRLGEDESRALFQKFTFPATRESIAGACVLSGESIVLDDVRCLPPGSQFKHNPAFDNAHNYETHSVLVVPMRTPAGRCLGVLQLINSQRGGVLGPFPVEDVELARALASQAAVAIDNAALTESLHSAQLDTLKRLGVAAEWRDKETANHITRVSLYSALLAERLGWSADNVELLRWAAPMHDVGKLGVPDAILNKPGKLDPEERALMELHPVIGAEILAGADSQELRLSYEIALGHHEKWDGTGYPNKLAGEAIPVSCRIVALADVYDALTSWRPYKEPFPHARAIEIITGDSGKHFDPAVVAAFVGCEREFPAIRDRFMDSLADFDKFRNKPLGAALNHGPQAGVGGVENN